MSLQCGIVGLPNVGKSTLFNAKAASIPTRIGERLPLSELAERLRVLGARPPQALPPG